MEHHRWPQEAFGRFDTANDVVLAVGGPLRYNLLTLQFRVKRSRYPLVQWLDRLNIMMVIDEESFRRGLRSNFTQYNWVPFFLWQNLSLDSRGVHVLLDNPRIAGKALPLGGHAWLSEECPEISRKDSWFL